ncbi:calcium uniporter protein, mitochondrial-like [Ptychodera flava]|uniref:calcium uniporter protein, mitochondrial-like n=1 Tax=Ptychodera flava TaxID=63121 RepID=UPI00396A5559
MASSGWFRLYPVGRIFVGKCGTKSFMPKKILTFPCCTNWQVSAALCSTAIPKNSVHCEYRNGLPVLYVPLPSRQEQCQFTLKPFTQNVGDLIQQLRSEDGGIERAAIYNKDDVKVAKATGIDALLRENFKLVINETSYDVDPPPQEVLDSEDAEKISDVKTLIQQLYSTLNVEEHQFNHEKALIKRLEDLKVKIEPYEQLKKELDMKAARRTNILVWGGLAYMSFQFGFLARLTWWEYSWDIMEPVTYFVGYGTAICFYAYYVLTRQEYTFEGAHDRQYLITFHKGAKKKQLNLADYNKLRDQIVKAEYDLERLRDPLQLNLPILQPPSNKVIAPELPEEKLAS